MQRLNGRSLLRSLRSRFLAFRSICRSRRALRASLPGLLFVAGCFWSAATLKSEASLARVLDGKPHTMTEVIGATDAAIAAYPPNRTNRILRAALMQIVAEARR